MTQTVYLKLSQITQVHEKNVPLASLGEVYCSEKSVESRCRAMIVKRIRGGGKQRESRLVGNVMEIIQQIEREIPGTSVQNLGETDYVIHYQPPRRQALVWQWCKTLFVCLICFFGAAFAIMTFNNDANVWMYSGKYMRSRRGRRRTEQRRWRSVIRSGFRWGFCCFLTILLRGNSVSIRRRWR